MGEREALSVVVPTKNRPELLSRCVRNFAGFASRIEIVVVDDHSEAAVAAINAKMCGRLENCVYIRNTQPEGAAAARNRGMARSTGQWIWFVDDDDEVPETTIEDVMATIAGERTRNLVLLLPGVEVAGDRVIKWIRPSARENTYDAYRRYGHSVNTSGAVFHRSTIDRVGGWDPTLVAGQDTDLFLRVARIAEFKCIDAEPVRIHVGHWKRITRNVLRQQVAKIQFLRKHWGVLHVSRKMYYVVSFCVVLPVIQVIRDFLVMKVRTSGRAKHAAVHGENGSRA